jgi:hypothetical protein
LHLNSCLERIHRGERTLARYEEGRNSAQKGCSQKGQQRRPPKKRSSVARQKGDSNPLKRLVADLHTIPARTR